MKGFLVSLLAAAMAAWTASASAQGALQDISPIERSDAFERGASAWDDNWGRDRYGYYDEDFSWETGIEERERWSTWYGDTDLGWNDWYEDMGDQTLYEIGPGDDEGIGGGLS